MNCCAGCFGDRGLRRNIIPLRSSSLGVCSYCGAVNIAIVPPRELGEYFELVVSAYKPDENGKLLIEWFRKDWLLFDNERLDDPKATVLLAEILDDGEIVRRKFSPLETEEGVGLAEWEKLRDELMYQNRFFPSANIDLDRLEQLLSLLKADNEEIPNAWSRARIQTGDVPFEAGQMGAPPKRNASHGRANPAGIPYLYLASTAPTAVSELRPHTGEIACVCAFTTRANLTFVDLRNPRKMVSPFLLEDAGDIARMRADLPFLERLGSELTRPVLPQAAAIDYTPSQYLCEFIKKCGYNGVLYRSSVSDGINLALFSPDLAQAGAVSQYRVSRVSVDVQPGA